MAALWLNPAHPEVVQAKQTCTLACNVDVAVKGGARQREFRGGDQDAVVTRREVKRGQNNTVASLHGTVQ